MDSQPTTQLAFHIRIRIWAWRVGDKLASSGQTLAQGFELLGEFQTPRAFRVIS